MSGITTTYSMPMQHDKGSADQAKHRGAMVDLMMDETIARHGIDRYINTLRCNKADDASVVVAQHGLRTQVGENPGPRPAVNLF